MGEEIGGYWEMAMADEPWWRTSLGGLDATAEGGAQNLRKRMAGMTYLMVDAGDEGSSDLRHRIRHKSVIYICTYHSHVLNLLQSELALGVGALIKEITIVFIKLPRASCPT